jgi:hypothetical protein
VPESLDQFAARLDAEIKAGHITRADGERQLAERAFGTAPDQRLPPAAAAENPRLPAVAKHLGELQGEGGWKTPPDYDSVALAAMDSIWSINAKYVGVQNVIARYLAARAEQGADGQHDAPEDLLAFIADHRSQAFADAVKNRQRTSTRSGILKAEAVKLAAELLAKHGINTPADLRELDAEDLAALEADWRAITGQRSGISFEYMLMLCGIEGVKVDRHIRRFVAEALGVPVAQISVADARALVTAAADQLGITWRVADYAIWDKMSSR